jgi:hypothetical protein
VSPVRYELGFYIPEDDILHSQSRDVLKPYNNEGVWPHDCLITPNYADEFSVRLILLRTSVVCRSIQFCWAQQMKGIS